MLEGNEIAEFEKLLDKAVNGSMGERQLVDIFVSYYELNHNTLSQSFIRAIKSAIGEIADTGRPVDARNEASLEWCRAVTYGVKFTNDGEYLPVREPRFIGLPVI